MSTEEDQLYTRTLYYDSTGKKIYQKQFEGKTIDKLGLKSVLDKNIQVFYSESGQVDQNLLPILSVKKVQNNLVMTVPFYEYRLDEHIKSSGFMYEKQIMAISQDILKSIYSLFLKGLTYSSLQAKNFVFHENHWKLQSLAFEQKVYAEPISSYLWNSEHRPPQFYSKDKFDNADFNMKVVWDFGCIIIHLITLNHKLKNKRILQKFKDQPFTFQAIGIKRLEKNISSQLKHMLGRMCHYNQTSRMHPKTLFQQGFFSKQLAINFQQIPQLKQKFNAPYYFPISQVATKQRSQFINRDIKDLKEFFQTHGFESEEAQICFSTIQDAMIRKEQYQILKLFKDYYDKGDILVSCASYIESALKLLKNQEQEKRILKVTKFALHFVQTMDLIQLYKAMLNNHQTPFFYSDPSQWDIFTQSLQFQALQHYTYYKLKNDIKIVDKLRVELLNNLSANLQGFSQDVLNFIKNRSHPQTYQFCNIKKAYYQIIRKSYDLIPDYYDLKKNQAWATIGMKITFCLVVDKMCIDSDTYRNFRFFLQQKGSFYNKNYATMNGFDKFMKTAKRQVLVKNSRYLLEKYFEI